MKFQVDKFGHIFLNMVKMLVIKNKKVFLLCFTTGENL